MSYAFVRKGNNCNRKNTTCDACHNADGSKHYGHDQNNLNRPQKADCAEEEIVKKRVEVRGGG